MPARRSTRLWAESALVGLAPPEPDVAPAGRDPTERVVGSVAFGAVARVVMAAAKVKGDDGEDKRVLVRSKSNIGPDGGGFAYAIDQVELDAHPGIQASRIAWGQAVEGTARELLAEPDDADDDAPGDAREFLRDLLDKGSMACSRPPTPATGS